MHIKTMKEKKRLRDETWFLYFLEKQIKLMKRSQDPTAFKKEIFKKIADIEKITKQKL